MKNKLKIVAYSAIPLIGLAMLSANIASAHGFDGFGSMFGFNFDSSLTPAQVATDMQSQFQSEATLLGISVDDVKAGWAEGKTLAQIAAAHNITEAQLQQKLKDQRLSEIKASLQNLVSSGVITQAQADSRLSFMENGKIGMHGRRGMGLKAKP